MVTFNYRGFRTEVQFKNDTVGGNVELGNGDYIPFMGNTLMEAFDSYVLAIDRFTGESINYEPTPKKAVDLSMYFNDQNRR